MLVLGGLDTIGGGQMDVEWRKNFIWVLEILLFQQSLLTGFILFFDDGQNEHAKDDQEQCIWGLKLSKNITFAS